MFRVKCPGHPGQPHSSPSWSLNRVLAQLAGGVIDERDAAADHRDRLQREPQAYELVC